MLKEVLKELKEYGSEQTVKILTNHGADLELYGVKVGDVKKIAKKYKGEHDLGVKLLHSKNQDAIYLSQYIVDASKLTKQDFIDVIEITGSYFLLEYALANLIVMQKKDMFDLIDEWIFSDNPRYQQVAWSVYSNALGYYPDDEFDMDDCHKKLDYINEYIHTSENRTKYCMNQFIIACGSFVEELNIHAKIVADNVGKVEVMMGKTSCKVPLAYDYIEKVEKKDRLGKKRKKL
jgi:hypothetical protein